MDEDSQSNTVSVNDLTDFVFNAATALLSASKKDIIYFKQNGILSIYDSFINDPIQASIFVSKVVTEDNETEFLISNKVNDVPNLMSGMMVIKEKGLIVDSLPIDAQLQVINLPLNHTKDSKSTFESLRNLVDLGIAPYFEVLSKLNLQDSVVEDMGSIGMTRKKINELVLSLQRLQQTVQVPDLKIGVHPKVKHIIESHVNDGGDMLEFVEGELMNDSNFLNDLQTTVNNWIKSVQEVTQLTRSPKDGSAKDEVNFWLSMEAALIDVQDQLKSTEIQLTLDILKKAKRFHATISFLSDTGIKESLNIAQTYNQLMKDLPFDEILSATSFNKLGEAIILVFNHLKKLRVSQYPIDRAILFVEAISSDVEQKMRSILQPMNIMSLNTDDFKGVMDEVQSCFDIFDSNVKDFTSMARELLRKRNEKFILVKVDSKTTGLQERVDYIIDFRNKHNEWIETITKVGKKDLASSLEYAYSAVEKADIADLSAEGKNKWDAIERTYNERTLKVLNALIAMLRKTLESAKNANEMFEIFDNFKFLLVQDSIRNAVQEYQSQLLNIVKSDIKNLQSQFLKQNEISKLFRLRDIPPVSSTIMWAKQIEQRLIFLTDRCELILGSNWREYPEGHKVHTEAMVFHSKLNTDAIFEAWLKDSLRHTDKSVEGLNIFKIVKSGKSSNYEIVVTFDHSVVTLFKEVRHLCWLGYDVPHSIVSSSRVIRKIYPHAIGLAESLLIWENSLDDMAKFDELCSLLALDMYQITELMSSLLSSKWDVLAKAHDLTKLTNMDNNHLEELDEIVTLNRVTLLEESIYKFLRKTIFLQNIRTKFNLLLSQLEECPYEYDHFHESIAGIQNLVNDIIFEDFSGTDELVTRLNNKILSILNLRCFNELQKWCSALKNDPLETGLKLKTSYLTISRHEIIFSDQTISIRPPLETSKKSWFNDLRRCINVIGMQTLINANTMAVHYGSKDHPKSVVFGLDTISPMVNECIDTLELKFDDLSTYMESWLSFQSLWDLDIEEVYNNLSDDVESWIQLIHEFKSSRETFDTAESAKDFGYAIVDYERAQSKINAKYDIWQRQIYTKFCGILIKSMRELDEDILKMRKLLEKADTNDCILLINIIHKVQSQIAGVERKLKNFKISEGLLIRNRFRFPSDWLPFDQVNDDFGSLLQIFDKRQNFIQTEIQSISQKLEIESTKLAESMSDITVKWSSEKPITGDLIPNYSLSILLEFESSMSKLESRRTQLIVSAEILNIHIRNLPSLSKLLEELADLKSVWLSIDTLWITLQSYRQQPWTNISSIELYRQLEDLLSKSRNMPARVRQYSAFSDVQEAIKSFIKSNKLIADLRSDWIKEHHWYLIFTSLNKVPVPFHQLTLGDVWDLNLLVNEPLVKKVIAQANGEKIVEEQINKVESTWQNTIFEFFNYKDKIRFVKRWDVLFEQCQDDLNSLTSMQNSIHYKVFEERGSRLIEKLNKLFRLLDVWIETQKEYVYVDGVFGSSTDIKKLLPLESSRFESITAEFFLLLKNIFKSPVVIDSLNVPDAQRSLERILELLTKIRKSLSEYLEKQRELFPRFYFVGNEDLLEIIGNAHDAVVVSRHFKAMFSGISGIIIDNSSIVAVTSPEGEVVELSCSVSFDKNTTLNSWLSDLEYEVRSSLSKILASAIADFKDILIKDAEAELLLTFIKRYQAQIIILAAQVCFTEKVKLAICSSEFADIKSIYSWFLEVLASAVLEDLGIVERKKYENLIIEFIHQRDIIAHLIEKDVQSLESFFWVEVQRFYYDETEQDPVLRLTVEQGGASFVYGFEYLGVQTRLVYTPLIDRCFLSMTQALNQQIGGSPFGPAGTGKTESIKALGQNLGKMVFVFCCDESFDFQAMGRILIGICEVGAWGCFDEFNRLDKKMLSAVSTQIEKIQYSLRSASNKASLLGKETIVHPETGIFVTMNPGYAGRSELPENLKKLFRSFSMNKPDREIIAEVVLNSQGFVSANDLASKVVPFFMKLESLSTKQIHYDFGLRSLKSMLSNCGLNKRKFRFATSESETATVLRSLNETISPKLINVDEKIFQTLLIEIFGTNKVPNENSDLLHDLGQVALGKGLSFGEEFMKRAFQLYQMQETHHGIILYGDAGIGKSTLWRTLLSALSLKENSEALFHIIDCKVMSKEELYGSLDPVTRDWNDGLLTSILRKINENLRGELSRRTWIVFDGDVDPEWIENLNSVLDDNKLLTLPNGERLSLPPNVRLVFEVDNLSYATPATISRCGIIYIANELYTPAQMLDKLLFDLQHEYVLEGQSSTSTNDQMLFLSAIKSMLHEEVLSQLLLNASQVKHIMKYDIVHSLKKLQIILSTFFNKISTSSHVENISKYATNAVLISCCWAFAGDASSDDRLSFSNIICDLFHHDHTKKSLVDFCIGSDDELTEFFVPSVILESQEVTRPDVIIPTSDTVKHEELIYSVINAHTPLIMCGPPGSGKTMTFLSALRKSPTLDFVDLNFSKETSPGLLLKIMEQYCEYRKTPNGTKLVPRAPGKWLVVFADEINLPKADKFNTQKVISLLRQMIERNGFYKNNQWVGLSNVQFVGACNPPSDIGRYDLSMRFLRNCMVISVNYPNTESLHQIYGTMLRPILTSHGLPQFANDFTRTIVQIYDGLRTDFADDVISPRDISRVVKGVYVYLEGSVSLDELLRLLVFNSLRVYCDKTPKESIRISMYQMICTVISDNFPNRDGSLFELPILYSNWLSNSYQEVDERELRSFVSERLKVFCEEEMDISLVLYDDLLDHVLRIDRVLKQPQGHLMLVGPSSSGKTTLTKFASWINGYKIVQLSTNRGFTLEDFDNQLRNILRRSAIQNEQISFIVDESNIIETSFLERMNNLLSSCEVPGLFEEDEIRAMTTSLSLEESEFAGYFKSKIAENLHVVITVGETGNGSGSQCLSSPALINRCVVNWMGDWSDLTLHQVGLSLMQSIDADMPEYKKPETFKKLVPTAAETYREVLVDIAVYFHRSVSKIAGSNMITPGQFLSFIEHFRKIFTKKEEKLQEYQRHINVGLENLRDTVLTVKLLKAELSEKNTALELKNKEANDMLGKMLTEQNEAERKREASIEIQMALEGQEKEIELHRAEVLSDLALAEPAVIEAARGVKNIKKEHLNELKAMRNPPDSVVLTLESVCSLLGYDTSSWRDVQLVIRGDTFISDIVNFDNSEKCSPEVIEFMEQKYLSRPDYNYAAANRGSKACGPLLQWVEAQIQFAAILDKITPLKEEVDALENHTNQTKRKLIAIEGMIQDLEDSIFHYKEAYSSLIRETENIKTEMEAVKIKVERSMKLMDDLTEERERWRASVKSFYKERAYLAGDALLSSAFLTYCGFYDQKTRSNLLRAWRSRLRSAGIEFDENFNVINYLSNPSDLINWKDNGLVNDDLFVENLIMIQNSERCPFLIDPSGKIVDVLSRNFSSKKLIITSFLAEGFVKQLENALRFGSAILIQDAEHFDPIISPILTKEIQRVGTRTLVRFGNQVIDWASGFELFLATRDPSIEIPLFVFSRTTVTNFTITQSSIITQSLDLTLKIEKPDIEQQRLDLIKLSGEYKIHLRELEDDLLTSLSTTEGNILENDKVLKTLQELKSEAKEISIKMEQTAHVMNTVDKVSDQYYPFVSACSMLFELLQSLKTLNQFYQFSLQYFTDVLEHVLKEGYEGSANRIEDLILRFYRELYSRTSLSLLYRDRVVLAMSMFVLYHESKEDISVRAVISEIAKLLPDDDYAENCSNDATNSIGNEICDERSSSWSKLEILAPILEALKLLDAEPERLMDSFTMVANFLFKTDTAFSSSYVAMDIVRNHRDPSRPIILVSPDGYDPSFKIANESLITIAMGSNEGTEMANAEILANAKEGGWLLLQNVQMSPQWLDRLEQKLTSVSPTKGFRLLLTCNLTSTIPMSLLRSSDVLMFENSPGIKLIMEETFKSVADKLNNATVEKRHIYFLLSWFHAVAQERLRYVPLGFTKRYDFNNTDFTAGIFIIDQLFSRIAENRSNIDPHLIPWEELQVLIGEIIYGGKTETADDHNLLKSLAEKIFVEESFKLDYKLVDDLVAPEGRSVDNYIEWIQKLPEVQPSSWLGLPADAEKKLSFQNSVNILKQVEKLVV